MKNEIIAELRRMRDLRAQRHNQDIESMLQELMKLDPWMEKKTFMMKDGRMVAMQSVHRRKPRQPSA